MKHIFEVTQNDFTEIYSERFNVVNKELNITTENYNLMDAINEFLSRFKDEYEYLRDIYDCDLNKEALKRKETFGRYINLYKRRGQHKCQ